MPLRSARSTVGESWTVSTSVDTPPVWTPRNLLDAPAVNGAAPPVRRCRCDRACWPQHHRHRAGAASQRGATPYVARHHGSAARREG